MHKYRLRALGCRFPPNPPQDVDFVLYALSYEEAREIVIGYLDGELIKYDALTALR